MKRELIHDNDCKGVPFTKVIEAINYMDYATDTRVMFEMLFITGCRISELDRMQINRIYDGWLYWNIGKNQQGMRKEKLPTKYIEELKKYRETNKVYDKKLFGISHKTFRRYFNKYVRPNLSKEWHQIRLKTNKCSPAIEYILQLKGLRKDFQTLEFSRQLEKWHDSGVAMEFTSKRMKHSSKQITAYHYLENFDGLGINNIKHLSTGDFLENFQKQTRLFDFIK